MNIYKVEWTESPTYCVYIYVLATDEAECLKLALKELEDQWFAHDVKIEEIDIELLPNKPQVIAANSYDYYDRG